MSIIDVSTAILRLANTDVFTKILEAWVKRGISDRSLAVTLEQPAGKVELAADTLNSAALELLVKQVLARNSVAQVQASEPEETAR